MSRSPDAVERRRIAVLRRRAEYLRAERERDPASLGNFALQELVALEWAVAVLERAMAASEAEAQK